MAFPLDYVFKGAQLMVSVTVPAVNVHKAIWLWEDPQVIEWFRKANLFLAYIGSRYKMVRSEANNVNGSIFAVVEANQDFNSINDIKRAVDYEVSAVGFPLLGSMVRFLSNPRRDDTKQPPVNTPGVPPPVTQLPPAAGNTDNYHKNDPTNPLEIAWNFWTKAAVDALGLDQLAKTFNLPDGKTLLYIGAGVLAVMIIKK
jgi:hypothetical protein